MTGDRDAQDIQKIFDMIGEIRASQIRTETFIEQCDGGRPRCITNGQRITALEQWREKTTGFWARLFWVFVTAGVGASVALFAKLMFP